MEAGICYIKKEYLVPDNKTSGEHNEIVCGENTNKRKNESNRDDDSNKREKYQKNKKDRKRGQNKNRPVYKEDRNLHLCHSLINGPTEKTCNLPNCRYIHDLEQYLGTKGEDLGDECPVFKAKGFCARGVTCRYARKHLDANGCNIKSANYDDNKQSTTFNGITSELQIRLRKHEYDFSRSKQTVTKFEKMRQEAKDAKTTTTATTNIDLDNDVTTDENDFKVKSSIDFKNKLILSPLTTVGNLPFRRLCKEFGADITCGEMACAVPLVKGLTQEWALTKRHESEDIFGIQLCGSNPTIITQAAQLIQDTGKVDYIDLNIGCPIDLIYQQGGGSALMRRTNILELTVRSCSALSINIPFTVKMRTGVYANNSVAHQLIPLVEEWGASAVTLHGRSREQRYTKTANWEYIEECAAMAKYMPIIGNGDILNFEDYNEKLKIAPHVTSVMIGRGALIKPWIFKEIKEQKAWDPSSTDRFNILRKFVNYGLEHWGSDTKGVETTRRFLLEWQSFLYRYLPYDLLEYPPQQINQRPQKFRGRDEMETLMSSSNSEDWVKLSEMLLGRVQPNFTFIPKHKANSY